MYFTIPDRIQKYLIKVVSHNVLAWKITNRRWININSKIINPANLVLVRVSSILIVKKYFWNFHYNYVIAFVVFEIFAFRDRIIQMASPVRNSKLDIISAWVGCRPKISRRVFTLIFSIKNRSNPLNIKYRPKSLPGILNFFLTDQIIRKRIKQITIS